MQVEQIDRDAAAEFLSDGPETVFHRNIRLGGVDKHPLIQAFARHRHQAREQVVGEIVVWLRGRSIPVDRLANQIEAKFGKKGK